MGGFAGIGGSSANTDRNTQLAAQQGNWNIFSYGLPQGQSGQSTGQGTLNTALNTLQPSQQYFNNLLTGGRTQTAQLAAPAINQAQANETATRNAEGTFGTNRVGGTNAQNREASTQTGSQVDNIINQTLQTGRATGAQGLEQISGAEAGIGSTQLSNALSLLGLSQNSINAIMQNATESRKTSYDINRQAQTDWATVADGVLSAIGI